MLDIRLEGFEEFQKKLEKMVEEDIKVEVVITNDHEAATTLEYGSIPGKRPWASAGKRTRIASDIFSRDEKIVSIRGYGMLRGNESKIKEHLANALKKINFDQNIKEQIINILTDSANLWVDNAKKDSVGDLIDNNWDIQVNV